MPLKVMAAWTLTGGTGSQVTASGLNGVGVKNLCCSVSSAATVSRMCLGGPAHNVVQESSLRGWNPFTADSKEGAHELPAGVAQQQVCADGERVSGPAQHVMFPEVLRHPGGDEPASIGCQEVE